MPMEKTFDAAKAETAIYAAWEATGAFRAGANASREETFCIMIPPPNVTGSLHVGHAFNNTLQDVLTRWHRMRGFDTLWQPGTDHAGIATQLVVEKKLAAEGNITRREMGREDFLKKVWEWRAQSGGQIINQLKRLGCSCDWEREAFTMSGAPGAPQKDEGNFHDAVLKVFVDLYNKGLIFRGKRLVNWDPHFETAISDLEVENIETPGHMWHFKYPLAGGETYEYVEKDADGNVTLREERDYISIATTRPETMLGDGAVAVHVDDARYAPIVGKFCEIPVGPKEHRRLIPIITDPYPDPNFGSGAVKITGAHDFNDYEVAKRGGIPMFRLMDTKGHMREDGAAYAETAAEAQEIAQGAEFTENSVDALNLVPDDLRGLDRFEARQKVVEQITAEGLAVMQEVTRTDKETGEEVTEIVPLVENKPIMQPFGDRSKVVIEPMLTDQWFVDAATLAKPALEMVRNGTVNILPEKDKKVYFHWLENIEPWCISRQLWWGHQVPVWYGPSKDKIAAYPDVLSDKPIEFCATSEEEVIEIAKKYYGADVDIRFFDEAVALTGNRGHIQSFGTSAGTLRDVTLTRDPDVLDTWFSSGLWPIGTLGWPEQTPELQRYFPTSVLVTGFDIIFFWVARMMMMQLEVVKEVPFKDVYLHALVRDEKGVKMSKTLGNVIDPLDLIDEFGADAVRLTMVSMAALGGTLKLSTERVKGNRNFGTKLWNAARFAQMNGCFEVAANNPVNSAPPEATATVNKWILGETARVRTKVDEALASYRFNDAALGLYAHVWHVFCDWYVEFSKPLLQGEDAALREETQAVMAWALDQCLILLHPIMPFITEQLWSDLNDRPKQLVHGDWPTYGAELADTDADAEMGWVIGLIEQVRSARSELNVPAGAKLPLVELSLDDAGRGRLARNRDLVARLARVSEFEAAEAAPKGAVTLPVEGGAFCLPLEGVIDVAAEEARLQKALGKVEKEVGGLQKKLSNEAFLAKAPEEVVDDQRSRLEAAGDEVAKLKAALARVEEMS